MINPTRQELITSLVDYINSATAIPPENVIRGKQNAPSPLGNYATLLYVRDQIIGAGEIVTETTVDPLELRYGIYGKRSYDFNIQFFRAGATDLAKLFMQYQLTPDGINFLQQAPYTFRNINELNENADVISQNYEERAILIVQLWVRESQELTVNAVREATINLTETDGVTDLNDTITVTPPSP